MGVYKVGTNYKLYNSVILNNRTTLYIINNRLRFINELRLSNNFIYTGTGIDLIKGIGTVAITI